MDPKNNNNGGETPPEVTPPTKEEFNKVTVELAELTKKQADLNQGIAKYRDEAQNANKRAEEFESKVQELETNLAELKGKGKVEMDQEDEAILEGWAEEKGFVSKAELDKFKAEQAIVNQTELQNQAVNEFLKTNSQYNTDENWTKVQQEFALYKTPTTLQGYRQILEKIHQTLSIPEAERRGGDKARAQFTTKSRLSLGGGPQGALSPEREATIEDLQKRYPNLSKEQISSRLDEIDVLYPEKK